MQRWCEMERHGIIILIFIRVGQGSSVVLFTDELSLFHVCWKDFIPQDFIPPCLSGPFYKHLDQFQHMKKAKVWFHGSGGEAAVHSCSRKLTFPSTVLLPFPHLLLSPAEISDQTVNSPSTESSKPPIPSPRGLVC